MIGTLTSSILKSMYTLISPIFSYKLCSVATPGHPEPFPLENHGRIVALTPDLQRISFYSVINFLYYSSTTELILSLILIKRSYPSSKASLLYRRLLLALWLLWYANLFRSPHGLVPLSKRLTIFRLKRNDPARPLIFTL